MQKLTAEQINLIHDTWRSIGPIVEMVPQIFYDRLFEIDASTKPLFANTDMPRQHRQFLDMLHLIAGNTHELDSIAPTLESLGLRHVAYGVEDQHYDSVGSALIWTLERSIGAEFTSEAREAWTLAYDNISDVMRRAANPQEAASG